MEYSIVKVNKDNYIMYDNMIFNNRNVREKNEDELTKDRNFTADYTALENENFYIFAIQTKNIFIGYITIAYIPKVGIDYHGYNGHLYIDELWINPNYRRKGLAKVLMDKADTLCREKKISGLRVGVYATNEEAISLYNQCGYEHIGTNLILEKQW